MLRRAYFQERVMTFPRTATLSVFLIKLSATFSADTCLQTCNCDPTKEENSEEVPGKGLLYFSTRKISTNPTKFPSLHFLTVSIDLQKRSQCQPRDTEFQYLTAPSRLTNFPVSHNHIGLSGAALGTATIRHFLQPYHPVVK